MGYLSEKEYNLRLKNIQIKNASIKRKQDLKAERNKYKSKLKLPTTSKLMAAYLFMILNIVLIYSMVAMWHFMDLTYLGVLITDVVAQVLTYFIYSIKSLKENTASEGFVYEARMSELKEPKTTSNNTDDYNAVG